jgi:hypothetical protein
VAVPAIAVGSELDDDEDYGDELEHDAAAISARE